MSTCKVCSGRIGILEGVSYLGYTYDKDCEVCNNCFNKLENVIYSPKINSEYDFDEYLNDLEETLKKLNIPLSRYAFLKNILKKNRATILKQNSKKATELEEKNIANAKSKSQKMYRTVWIPANSDETAISIESTCNDYEKHGYQLVSTTPIIKGIHGGINDGGYGYSVTDGVILTFHRVNQITEPVPSDKK